ncbi:hypothetical protein BDD43_3772 [Mucilaginibacter gracilis]|uniref:Surface antigen-like protein n=1 Tax=Mucilaginibacter gracilis TaxID=423350 RepID=A0A495J4N9_9SPHI|nr:hypothetical protein [Mucilaginibacter gracilis]RKR83562.1 hypothetical protein BDD43_3772 [Mucilaginibacter gracilis]
MPLKKTLLLLCLLPSVLFAQNASDIIPVNKTLNDTSEQRDLIDIAKKIVHIESKPVKDDKDKKYFFSFLPIGANVPGGTGRALITSTTAGVYLGPRKTTNLSSASFAPYWNLGDRFGLPLRTSVWLPGNTWTVQGDVRFLRYPQNSWGLGSSRGNDDETQINYEYIRFYQAALKRITPYFFAGVGYNLDYHFGIGPDDPQVDLAKFTGYNNGIAGSSVSSGISLNAVYDTRSKSRNNDINPMPGAYASIVYRINPTFLGSNNYWHSLYVDLRKYVSMNPARPNQQNTLAFWGYLWTVFDSNAPYLDLPSLGWDPFNRSGRGFDQNRYRGKSLAYLEAEYRRDITNDGLFGFVVFTNANSVSGSGTFLTSWHPAVGSGLRVKFNKESQTNIGVDYGVSKGYSSFSVNLAEAF